MQGVHIRAVFRQGWVLVVEGLLVLTDVFERVVGTWLLPSTRLKVVIGFAALVVAQYRAYRRMQMELRSQEDLEIKKLQEELKQASRRPYDEEHRRLAELRVNAISEAGRDMVYFLLHNGKTEAEELRRHCLHDPEFNPAVQGAREQGLVLGSTAPIPGRSGVDYFWEVNQQFENVLRELLGQRNARFFR